MAFFRGHRIRKRLVFLEPRAVSVVFDAIDPCPSAEGTVPDEDRNEAVLVSRRVATAQRLSDDVDACVGVVAVVEKFTAERRDCALAGCSVLPAGHVNGRAAFDVASDERADEFDGDSVGGLHSTGYLSRRGLVLRVEQPFMSGPRRDTLGVVR